MLSGDQKETKKGVLRRRERGRRPCGGAAMMRWRARFHPCAVKFSPYGPAHVAVATSQHFGVVGNGECVVLDVKDGVQPPPPHAALVSNDAQLDVCWSETCESVVVVACGDGGVRLFDRNLGGRPLAVLAEHAAEVSSVRWAPGGSSHFVSTSWDGSCRLWNVEAPQSVTSIILGPFPVYESSWSVFEDSLCALIAGDGVLRVWDTRGGHTCVWWCLMLPAGAIVSASRAHDGEGLAVDWGKYDHNQLVTGGVDRTVKVWVRLVSGMGR